ncbi:hypothetical protein HDU67_004384 [Dinochytrium kinnereticum]|nr:hypothetical protein HDU67_004384 [Dinochytrium kinnereticum]
MMTPRISSFNSTPAAWSESPRTSKNSTPLSVAVTFQPFKADDFPTLEFAQCSAVSQTKDRTPLATNDSFGTCNGTSTTSLVIINQESKCQQSWNIKASKWMKTAPFRPFAADDFPSLGSPRRKLIERSKKISPVSNVGVENASGTSKESVASSFWDSLTDPSASITHAARQKPVIKPLQVTVDLAAHISPRVEPLAEESLAIPEESLEISAGNVNLCHRINSDSVGNEAQDRSKIVYATADASLKQDIKRQHVTVSSPSLCTTTDADSAVIVTPSICGSFTATTRDGQDDSIIPTGSSQESVTRRTRRGRRGRGRGQRPDKVLDKVYVEKSSTSQPCPIKASSNATRRFHPLPPKPVHALPPRPLQILPPRPLSQLFAPMPQMPYVPHPPVAFSSCFPPPSAPRLLPPPPLPFLPLPIQHPTYLLNGENGWGVVVAPPTMWRFWRNGTVATPAH